MRIGKTAWISENNWLQKLFFSRQIDCAERTFYEIINLWNIAICSDPKNLQWPKNLFLWFWKHQIRTFKSSVWWFDTASCRQGEKKGRLLILSWHATNQKSVKHQEACWGSAGEWERTRNCGDLLKISSFYIIFRTWPPFQSVEKPNLLPWPFFWARELGCYLFKGRPLDGTFLKMDHIIIQVKNRF